MAEINQEELIRKACRAYGINQKYLLGSRVYEDGEVVLVTEGGSKVRWRDGQEVEKLSEVAVTGIAPKKPKK